jgi:negative regulator of sigma E activity
MKRLESQFGWSEGWLEQGFVGSVHDIHSVERGNDIEIELVGDGLDAPASGTHQECEVSHVMTR